MISIICLKKYDRIVSLGQEVGFRCSTMYLQVVNEMGSNMLQLAQHLGTSRKTGELCVVSGLNLLIFVLKKDENFSH